VNGQKWKARTPSRIVVDSHARTPVEAKILHKGSGVRVIATSHAAPAEEITRLKQYAQVMQCGDERVDLTVLMEKLVEMGINRLMVEGGGTLIFSMLAAGLVDELIMFVGNMIIGGKDAPTLADGSGFISEADFCPWSESVSSPWMKEYCSTGKSEIKRKTYK
jgi:2,5-diamino-6-(ribosylamino)-4(3H)-pyrimidinone 5'-phosphate reductase